MKAEELMIGDWVCLEDTNLPLEERYFKIEYLAISAGVSWVNQGTNAPIGLGDGKSLIPVFTDEIYPIPLTPEILEKNGFKKDFELKGCYWRPDCRKYCIVKEIETWYFAFRHMGGGHICISECNYVHELQHLLKLCKIDKEIVL